MLFSKIKPKPKMKVSGKKKGKRGLTGKSPFADQSAGITYKKLFR
jgi:hypothetical protein